MNSNKSIIIKYAKRITAIVVMLISITGTMYFLQYYFSTPADYDQARMIQFKKQPSNSIDVIMLGSSSTYSGFSSAYAYDKFGFTSFPYTIVGAYCSMWKPAVQNILLTQKPKLM